MWTVAKEQTFICSQNVQQDSHDIGHRVVSASSFFNDKWKKSVANLLISVAHNKNCHLSLMTSFVKRPPGQRILVPQWDSNREPWDLHILIHYNDTSIPCESKFTLRKLTFIFKVSNGHMFWKNVISRIVWYHFCVVCFNAWIKMRHCLKECKNWLAPKYQSERMNWMYQIRCIAFAFCRNKVTHISAYKCSLIFDMCGMINFDRFSCLHAPWALHRVDLARYKLHYYYYYY